MITFLPNPITAPRPSCAAGYARNAGQSRKPNFWTGLVGLYDPTLGTTGLRAFDRSGRKNFGTFTNMTVANGWVSSPHGWAWKFVAGLNQSIHLANGPASTGHITVTMLARLMTAPDNTYLMCGTNNRRAFFVDAADINWFDPLWGVGVDIPRPASGEWFLIHGTWDGVVARIHHNGIEANSNIPGGAPGAVTAWRIGARDDNSQHTSAEVAFAAIHNRVLSPGEILDQVPKVNDLLTLRSSPASIGTVGGFVPYPLRMMMETDGGLAV